MSLPLIAERPRYLRADTILFFFLFSLKKSIILPGIRTHQIKEKNSLKIKTFMKKIIL